MSLGLSNANIATMAFQDDSCSMDYVGIEGTYEQAIGTDVKNFLS